MKNICKAVKISLTGMLFIPIVGTMVILASPFALWSYLKERSRYYKRMS